VRTSGRLHSPITVAATTAAAGMGRAEEDRDGDEKGYGGHGTDSQAKCHKGSAESVFCLG